LVLSCIFLILMLGCVGESPISQPPAEEIDETNANYPAERPLISLGAEYNFGLEDLDPYIIGDAEGWFDEQTAKGINIISFSPFDLEGYMIFDSPALREAGFKLDPEYPNLLSDILSEAKMHNMTVVLMIEGIAHIIGDMMPYSEEIKKEKLIPKLVENLIRDIANLAKKEDVDIYISEEAFEEEYIDSIARASKTYGVGYMHFFEDLKCRADVFISEDYAYYPRNAEKDPKDRAYLQKLWKLGTYYGELGNLNVMYATAKGCGIEAQTLTAGGWGLGPRTHQNIALFRSVQYGPRTYYFVVAEGGEGPIYGEEVEYVENYNFKERLLPLLEEFGRKKSDPLKPVANLIIDEPKKGEDIIDFYNQAFLSSMSAVTNSLLASGYDIVVTAQPVINASLYYVFSAGEIFDEMQDLPLQLAALSKSNVPVFYQVAGGIPDMPHWNIVTLALGISRKYTPISSAASFDPIPRSVLAVFPLGEYKIKYRGYSFEFWNKDDAGTFNVGHYLNYINPEELDESVDVLLSGFTAKDGDKKFDDKTALILRHGNVYFVNGGYLHLDASTFLANIMAETRGSPAVYNKPSYGYFTNGETRSAFFAPYEVEIDINLLGGDKVIEFDENGEKVYDSKVKLENSRLTGRLGKYHLLVVN